MKALALSAILFALSGVCHADWQYAKWGMAVDEVRAASSGKAHDLTPSEAKTWRPARDAVSTARLSASFRTGDLDFTAIFFFDSQGKLTAVNLELHDSARGPELASAVREKYGKPIDHSDLGYVQTWTWKTDLDEIWLITAGSAHRLRYEPRHRSNAAEL